MRLVIILFLTCSLLLVGCQSGSENPVSPIAGETPSPIGEVDPYMAVVIAERGILGLTPDGKYADAIRTYDIRRREIFARPDSDEVVYYLYELSDSLGFEHHVLVDAETCKAVSLPNYYDKDRTERMEALRDTGHVELTGEEPILCLPYGTFALPAADGTYFLILASENRTAVYDSARDSYEEMFAPSEPGATE